MSAHVPDTFGTVQFPKQQSRAERANEEMSENWIGIFMLVHNTVLNMRRVKWTHLAPYMVQLFYTSFSVY